MVIKNIFCMSALALLLAACNQKEAAEESVEESKEVVMTEAETPEETLILETSEISSAVYTVETINYSTRVATLKDENGELSSITASEEAQNLDQVKVGSKVLVEYLKDISVELVNDQALEPAIVEVVETERAEKGEKPAMEAIDTVVIIFKVEAINTENSSFKLRDPNGEITQYEAKNPENLKRANVGDAVILSVTEAVAISLMDDEEENAQ